MSGSLGEWIIDGETEYQNFTIPKHLKSICLSTYGIPISRHDVLNYVAYNGAIHLNPSTRKHFAAFQALDKFTKGIWINGKRLPYLEAQAVVFHLNHSECTIELKKILNSEFKDSLDWEFV